MGLNPTNKSHQVTFASEFVADAQNLTQAAKLACFTNVH